ncbi:MAG: class I SAM-dependent methyltransferase [Promethearchaeota archaeon]
MNQKSFKWDAELYQKSSRWQFELGLIAIERLKPKDGENILEIGCGNAMLTIEIAKKIPNGSITAIELSTDMISQANKNLLKFGINNVEILRMNALDITYQNKFDAVFSNSAIHWIINLELMYELIYNALNDKGRMIIQTGLKELNVLFKALYKISKLSKYKEYFNSIEFPWRFLSTKETKLILKKIGFKEINTEIYKFNRTFRDENELINYSKAAALVPYLSVLPNELKNGFIDKFKEIMLELIPPNKLELKMTRLFNQAIKRNN